MRQRSKVVRFLVGLGVSVVGLALALSLGFGWYVAGFIVEPPFVRNPPAVSPGPIRDPLRDHRLPFEEIEFVAEDGLVLRGWWIPRADASRAIVGVHGAAGTRISFLSLARDFHDGGYAVLLYDSRGHGESDGANIGDAFSGGYKDVLAAARFPRETHGIEKVAAIGSSQGGVSVLLAGGLGDELDAVISQSGGTHLYALLRGLPELAQVLDFEVDVIAVIAKWRIGSPLETLFDREAGPLAVVAQISPTPLLLIHGSEDTQASVGQAHELFDRAREPKELWIIEGGGHRGLRTFAKAEYAPRVLSFLEQRMR